MKNSIKLLLPLLLLALLFSGCSNKCVNCYGTAKVDCSTCSGTGKVNCSTCSGTGKVNCPYCYGEGEQTCSSCFGSGKESRYDYGYDYNIGGQYHYYYGQFTCRNCNGSGKIKCSNYGCENGKVKCSNYSCENGKVKCSNYSCEDGKVTCTMCKGTGEEESGFFSGIKDGFLIVFSLIGKIFSSKVSIYASNNSGLFYWGGFILGISLFASVGGSSEK